MSLLISSRDAAKMLSSVTGRRYSETQASRLLTDLRHPLPGVSSRMVRYRREAVEARALLLRDALPAAEAAAFLGIPLSTLRQGLSIPKVRLGGGRIGYYRRDLERLAQGAARE